MKIYICDADFLPLRARIARLTGCEILTSPVNHMVRSPRAVTSKLRDLKFAMLSCPRVLPPPACEFACGCDAMCAEVDSREFEARVSSEPARPARSSRFAHVWRQIRPLFLLLPSSLPPSLPPHYTHLTIIRQEVLPRHPAMRSQLWRAFHAAIFLG